MIEMIKADIGNEVTGRVINICKSLNTEKTQTVLMMQTFCRNEGLGNRKESGLDMMMSSVFSVSNSGDYEFNFALSFYILSIPAKTA